METLKDIAAWCGYVMGILGLILFIFKPFKVYLDKLNKVMEGQKCQLRADMLRVYYRHKEDQKIRQYEKENFLMEHESYKALGGNSFIDDITKEVRTWEVIT